jgi:predicted ferric reductase
MGHAQHHLHHQRRFANANMPAVAAAISLERRQDNSTLTDDGHTGFASLFPFSTGLNGVDQDSNYFYAQVLGLTFVGLLIFTLTLRWAKMAIAHFRHMAVLSNTSKQQFWAENKTTWWPSIKKHVLYAPMFNVRHNREIQLTSAISIGTLPSRGHTLILGMYILTNLAYCLVLPYKNPDSNYVWAQLRGRSGMLAALNIIPTALFALRNNPLIWMLQTPYDTFNLLHRWIGRIFIIESLVHTLAWMVVTVNQSQGKWSAVRMGLETGKHGPSYTWGMVSMIVLLIISVQTISPLRHAFYETFLNVHKVLAVVALIGVFMHLKLDSLPQVPWLNLVFALWIGEYICRVFHLVYRNYSRQKGVTHVKVEALEAQACRVTFELARPWRPRSGCHVHVYIPSISILAGFNSHPFSVAWDNVRPVAIKEKDDDLPLHAKEIDYDRKEQLQGSISLVVRARTGFTRALYEKASQQPGGVLHTRGAVEGPYGGHEKLNSYGTDILFAGGVGITHQVTYVRDLIRGAHNGTAAAKKVILVWSVPNTESLEWVRPWMDEILKMPGRRDVLKIMLFITKPRNHLEVVSGTGTVQMFPGRCNPQTVLDKEIHDRVGAVAVTVCGPGAFADNVRKAARARVYVGVVDFVEEAFTY